MQRPDSGFLARFGVSVRGFLLLVLVLNEFNHQRLNAEVYLEGVDAFIEIVDTVLMLRPGDVELVLGNDTALRFLVQSGLNSGVVLAHIFDYSIPLHNDRLYLHLRLLEPILESPHFFVVCLWIVEENSSNGRLDKSLQILMMLAGNSRQGWRT